MKKSVKILAGVLAVAAIGGIIGYGVYNYRRSGESDGIPRNAVPAQIEAAGSETIVERITARGVVELVDKYTVYPRGQGRVSEVLVKKGDTVTPGQVILKYDGEGFEDLRKSLAEAELALKGAELGLRQAHLPVVSQIEIYQAEAGIAQAEDSIADIEAQVSQYDLNLEQLDESISMAEKRYDNTRLLYDNGVVAKQELDMAFENLKQLRDQRATTESQREAAVDLLTRAKEAVHRAEEQYELTLGRQSEPQVAANIELQELQVEQARLRISQIEHEMDRMVTQEVCAYGGVVLELGAVAGEVLTAAKPLLVVADVSAENLAITVSVPEADASRLETGQKVEIRGSALGDRAYPGAVGKLSQIAEEQMVGNSLMRVITAEILPEEDAGLKAGYTVEAAITTRVAENATIVPLMATLTSETGEDYVFVMKEDFSVEQRFVVLGSYTGMYIEVISGVALGEKVVVNPAASLKDGGYVRPVGSAGE